MGVPAHQATPRHLGAAYPFASEAGLGGALTKVSIRLGGKGADAG